MKNRTLHAVPIQAYCKWLIFPSSRGNRLFSGTIGSRTFLDGHINGTRCYVDFNDYTRTFILSNVRMYTCCYLGPLLTAQRCRTTGPRASGTASPGTPGPRTSRESGLSNRATAWQPPRYPLRSPSWLMRIVPPVYWCRKSIEGRSTIKMIGNRARFQELYFFVILLIRSQREKSAAHTVI